MSNNSKKNDPARFILAVEEAFFILDRDHDRSISADDFCAVAKSAGIDLDSDEALLLLRTVLHEQTDDPSSETKLTVDQYSALMLRHIGPSELNDELRRTFDTLDQDHDGKISRQDIDQLRDKNNFFDKLDHMQYELMVKELLLHGNDGMDFEEFVRFMMH